MPRKLGNQCPLSAFLYSPPAERDKVGQRGTSLDRTDKIGTPKQMGLIREGTFLSFTTGTLLCSWLALIFSLYTLLCSVPPFFSQKLDIRVMQSYFLAARPGLMVATALCASMYHF